MASKLDKEIEFKIGGVFVSHECAHEDDEGAETDATDIEDEEEDDLASKSNAPGMMYSQHDIETKIAREQEKAKKRWRRKKQSYLAQMSLMQQKIDQLEQKKAEFDVKNKEIDGIICEFEKTAETVAEEKESQIYDLVQERQRLQTQTNELQLKNTAAADEIQSGRDRMSLLDAQHRKRLEKLQLTQQHAKQAVQSDMTEHQKVIDTTSERTMQHQRILADGEKTKENLQNAQKDAQANLDSIRTELKSSLAMVKSQREEAQNALLKLRQNAMSALKEHKELTKKMSALNTAKSEWTRKHQVACEQDTKMQTELEQGKQKLATLEAAKKTAVLEAYRWGEDKDKQTNRLKSERAKTSELVDIRNELEQQKQSRA